MLGGWRRVCQSFAIVGVIMVLTGCLGARTAPLHSTPPASPSDSSPAPRTPTPTAPRTTHATSPAPSYPGCRTEGDPRAGVNTPLRLLLRSRCIRVSGIAGCIWVNRGDGDTHIALLLPPRDRKKYLTPGNRSWTCDSDQGSDTAPRLVIEVIPQHCIVRPDNCADRGHFTSPAIPANGQHITVTGPWVQDTSHFLGRTMWSEIHPAWKIDVNPNYPAVAVQHGGDFKRMRGD